MRAFMQLNKPKQKTNTNSLTQNAIKLLCYEGFVAWRNNNGSVYDKKKNIYRKNPTTKLGVPDIIGYRKSDGKAIYIEIKTGKDRLNIQQASFLDEANKANCIAFMIRSIDELQEKLNKISS